MTFAGIDTGFGFTKVVYGDNRSFIFKTAVEPYIHSEKRFGKNADIVSVKEKLFLVGPDATQAWHATFDFVGSEQYYAVIAYCLHQIYKSGNRLSGIALGLPPAMFNERKTILLRNEIEKAELMVNKTPVAVPEKIVFIPQGVGAYIDFILNNPEYDGKDVIVIDIGYYTLDIIFIKEGRFIPEASKSYPSGIEFLLEKISDAFTNRYGFFINNSTAETLLKKGSFHELGREYKFNSEEILYNFYIPEIVTRIKKYSVYLRKNFEVDPIKTIVIAGGGAIYIKNMIEGAIFLPEPQFANARGYKAYIEKLSE